MKQMLIHSVIGLFATVVFVQAVPVQPAGVQPSWLQELSGQTTVMDSRVYAQSSGGILMRGTGPGAEIAADYGFGSDLTALFRWRRWRHPLRPGGVISWINPGAWAQDPYRTLTVLAGELILIGASVAIAEGLSDDDGGGGAEPAPAPPPAPTTSGGTGGSSGGSPSTASTPPPSTSGGSSGGGGSSGSTTVGAGGDELPF